MQKRELPALSHHTVPGVTAGLIPPVGSLKKPHGFCARFTEKGRPITPQLMLSERGLGPGVPPLKNLSEMQILKPTSDLLNKEFRSEAQQLVNETTRRF